MPIYLVCRLSSFFALLLLSFSVCSETVLVAVASNFSEPMTEIAAGFAKATGHEAKLAFGSSGKFVAQIENGAPFEVLLSADEKGPSKLVQAQLAEANSRFVYALGRLVLWSATANFVDAEGKVLSSGQFKHLALADPKLAPYGLAAMEVLQKLGLLAKLQPLFVQGENIAQTLQFISTGNAELGFVAYSQVLENGKISQGSVWLVPSESYTPIRQSAVLLKKGAKNPAAAALLAYLQTPEALAVIKQYGYDLP